MNMLSLLGRTNSLFQEDYKSILSELRNKLSSANVLVVGGAGSIGQSVARELFSLEPKSLHVIDISENNLVELVRSIRSTLGYNKTDFQTFVIDIGDPLFDMFLEKNNAYDYVFNLSALKHVRSERDPFTLLRMIQVNVVNPIKLKAYCEKSGTQNLFCVSTDKAANPVNLMGASKRLMERCLFGPNSEVKVSMARFANVAFSDGSLLYGFSQRLLNGEPITAPSDVQRYFMTGSEAGILCIIAGILGEQNEIFFPKLLEELHLTYFTDIAERFLKSKGFTPYQCNSEEEARSNTRKLITSGKWPVYYFQSDTTGEKPFEEFTTKDETPILTKYKDIGIIKNTDYFDSSTRQAFLDEFKVIINSQNLSKMKLSDLIQKFLPELVYEEKNKNLHERM